MCKFYITAYTHRQLFTIARTTTTNEGLLFLQKLGVTYGGPKSKPLPVSEIAFIRQIKV